VTKFLNHADGFRVTSVTNLNVRSHASVGERIAVGSAIPRGRVFTPTALNIKRVASVASAPWEGLVSLIFEPQSGFQKGILEMRCPESKTNLQNDLLVTGAMLLIIVSCMAVVILSFAPAYA
jgi:hypothetical protein